MNIFDILCTSARAQNFAGGPGHTGNEVTYTKATMNVSLILDNTYM